MKGDFKRATTMLEHIFIQFKESKSFPRVKEELDRLVSESKLFVANESGCTSYYEGRKVISIYGNSKVEFSIVPIELLIPKIQSLCKARQYDTAIKLTNEIPNKDIAVEAHLLCIEQEKNFLLIKNEGKKNVQH